MINFKNLKQYTQVTNSIKFSIDTKEPTILIYFSENSNFIEDYNKLNLRKQDFRIVITPVTTVPRTRMTPDLAKVYKSLGLIPYNMNQKIQAGKNVILDMSQYISAVENQLHPKNYRQRAGFLIKNAMMSAANMFPNNYQKILMYSVDLNNDINNLIDRKNFLIIKDMKDDEYPFDHMILNTISNGDSSYRLLVKDSDFNFHRILTYLRKLKGISVEDQDAEAFKAANMIIKALDKQITNKTGIRVAIQNFFKKSPDDALKVTSGDINADEIKTIATASILFNSSGDIERAKNIAKNVPTNKKLKALKAIDNSLAGDIIPREKIDSLTTNISMDSYDPIKMTDNISPAHIYKKRQMDFEKNLKTDFTNSFKVLESKEIPLKISKIDIIEKPGRKNEILKSDLNLVTVTMTDQFDNVHNIKLEIPRIDPDTGVFRINGKQKCLVNQIVQNPITFPAPGESRFESSYSVFRIYHKKLRSAEFLESFMSYKMPFFYLIAFSFGFEETCKQYKIKYELTETKPSKTDLFVKLNKKQYIIFKDVKTDLQRLLVNGFIYGKPEQYNLTSEVLSKKYFEDIIIKITGRVNSTFLISSNLQNIIDPVVKQILTQKQLPTDLNYIMQYMAEKVVQGYHVTRNDLANQRIRNSEVLVHLAQKQILAAYTVYKEQVLSGNTEAQFDISPTKVLSDFMMTEIVTDMEYANPIEEMSTMTRVSPSGSKVGGIPDKRAINNDSRNIHESYFGNIDPLDTPEGGNIGVVQQLTIDALISSSRGMFSTKDIDDKEKSGMLSTTTCMVPFLENTDGARVIMLSNQAKQMLPLKDPQPPVVQSGYESILTNVLSDNFIKRATCTGKVVKITDNEITIKCVNGKMNVIDISPEHLRSGSGKNTLSVFNALVSEGQLVREGELVAEGACMSQGTISLGRPLLTAMMPYKGYNFEDGVVISESVIKNGKLTSLHGIEEEVIVAENDKILEIAKIGEYVEKGQPLLKKTFGDIDDIIGFEDDESTDMVAGQFIKKSPGGKIVDILVYSNAGDDFGGLGDLIKKTNKKFGKPSKEKFTFKGETVKGVFIVFRLEQELPLGLGDKICNKFGNKGIVSLIEPEDQMPRMPNGDRVEIVFNPLGLINRMNIGQLYEMYCGLMAKELGSRIPKMKKNDVLNLIKKVYGELDTSPNKKSTEILVNNIKKLTDKKYKEMVDQIKESGFYPIIIPPFKSPKHDAIGRALKILGLETKYQLYIPEYNTKTASKVPVGYMSISKLEHMGDAKVYARSTGPLTGKTAQPTGGKRRGGGQRLGELDSYCLISYAAEHTLAELMGPLSDDFAAKDALVSEIIQRGDAEYKEATVSPVKDLLNSYFISLMLTKD